MEDTFRARTSLFSLLGLRLAIALVAVSTGAIAEEKEEKEQADVRYVAIGDSYTIGEGAEPHQAWPILLTKHLQANGIDIELVANPSRTGWTTLNAIDRELPIFVQEKPNFATLMIGVNDWVQGVDEQTFRQRFTALVGRMLELLPDKRRLVVITIPDFGVTPTGPKYAHGRNISEGITAFNKIITEEARRRDLRVIDVFPLSKQMQNDRSLVAGDGLHPSAKEYAEWEKIIFPVAAELLRKSSGP
jgi:acyl-CoA thioesterase I